MNQLHRMKNPWASGSITVQCQNCNHVFTAQRINCFDTLLWPEGRQVLDEENFFHPICPHCQARADLGYPSRYIDKDLGIAAVLVPGIENQDTGQLLMHMNRYMGRLALDNMEHRAVGSFYAMAEQMRIHQNHLNDKAIQLLKPFIIGDLQSRGLEVWNGFFMGLLHPEENEQREDVYQFYIYLTSGEIIPQGINDTAYRICMNILEKNALAEDDGLFHFYDLSWAIHMHNSLRQA